jgi:hypothetical protein
MCDAVIGDPTGVEKGSGKRKPVGSPAAVESGEEDDRIGPCDESMTSAIAVELAPSFIAADVDVGSGGGDEGNATSDKGATQQTRRKKSKPTIERGALSVLAGVNGEKDE